MIMDKGLVTGSVLIDLATVDHCLVSYLEGIRSSADFRGEIKKNRHDVRGCQVKGVLITSLLFQKQKRKDQGSGKLIRSLQF